jgi:hypothetical protein
MYSMADDNGGVGASAPPGSRLAPGATGPIYDTINDDSGSYSKSNGSDHSEGSSAIGSAAGGTSLGTTFGMPVAPPLPPNNGYQNGAGRLNPGYAPGSNEYDVPEGSETGRRVSGTVTINGITV